MLALFGYMQDKLVFQQLKNKWSIYLFAVSHTSSLSFTRWVLSPLAEALEAALALRVLTTRINGCFGNIWAHG